MELIDNINRLLGDDLKRTIEPGGRLKVAASCFSMYAFEACKAELERLDALEVIITSPTFVADEATDENSQGTQGVPHSQGQTRSSPPTKRGARCCPMLAATTALRRLTWN